MKINRTKKYNQLIYGKNIYSLLFAISQMEKGKINIILNDVEFSYGDFFTKEIDCIEKLYLSYWGVESKNECLISINKYLELSEYTLILDGTMLNLGKNDPYQNLKEIFRKTSVLFDSLDFNIIFKELNIDQKQFNLEFFNYCDKFAYELFHINHFNNIRSDKFIETLPHSLRVFFDHFLETNSILSKLFIYILNIKKYSRISTSMSSFEKLYSFIIILAPNYRLKRKSIEIDLTKKYLQKGKLLTSNIKRWESSKKSWSILTSGFEGIIFPEKIYFLGDNINSLNLYIEENMSFYRSIHIKIPRKVNHYYTQDFQTTLLIIEPEMLGTSFSSLRIEFFEEFISVSLYIPFIKGDKIEFIQKRYLNDIVLYLHKYFVNVIELIDLNDYNFSFGDDFVIDQIYRYKRLDDEVRFKHYKILNLNTSQRTKMNKVCYIGHMRELPLDKIGLFWEMRNVARFS